MAKAWKGRAFLEEHPVFKNIEDLSQIPAIVLPILVDVQRRPSGEMIAKAPLEIGRIVRQSRRYLGARGMLVAQELLLQCHVAQQFARETLSCGSEAQADARAVVLEQGPELRRDRAESLMVLPQLIDHRTALSLPVVESCA